MVLHLITMAIQPINIKGNKKSLKFSKLRVLGHKTKEDEWRVCLNCNLEHLREENLKEENLKFLIYKLVRELWNQKYG